MGKVLIWNALLYNQPAVTCMEECTSIVPNNKKKKTQSLLKLRIQGIEPWSVPWEGTMIPLHQMRPWDLLLIQKN